MLILSRKKDESIMIGDQIEISVVDIKGDQIKLGIKAPRDIKVYRQEVFTAIQQENQAAAKTGTQLPEIDLLSQTGERVNTPNEISVENKKK
ncbi:MAG: carbon storage regulator CsrA [Spirochaetia bacterium]|nr:carbon storage regulator CsrA [Spirochaetia bacterium]